MKYFLLSKYISIWFNNILVVIWQANSIIMRWTVRILNLFLVFVVYESYREWAERERHTIMDTCTACVDEKASFVAVRAVDVMIAG